MNGGGIYLKWRIYTAQFCLGYEAFGKENEFISFWLPSSNTPLWPWALERREWMPNVYLERKWINWSSLRNSEGFASSSLGKSAKAQTPRRSRSVTLSRRTLRTFWTPGTQFSSEGLSVETWRCVCSEGQFYLLSSPLPNNSLTPNSTCFFYKARIVWGLSSFVHFVWPNISLSISPFLLSFTWMRLSVLAFILCLLSKASLLPARSHHCTARHSKATKAFSSLFPLSASPLSTPNPGPLLSHVCFPTLNSLQTTLQAHESRPGFDCYRHFFLLPPQGLGKLTEGTCPSVLRRISRSGPAKTLGGWVIVIPKTVWEEMEIGNKAEGMHGLPWIPQDTSISPGKPSWSSFPLLSHPKHFSFSKPVSPL